MKDKNYIDTWYDNSLKILNEKEQILNDCCHLTKGFYWLCTSMCIGFIASLVVIGYNL